MKGSRGLMMIILIKRGKLKNRDSYIVRILFSRPVALQALIANWRPDKNKVVGREPGSCDKVPICVPIKACVSVRPRIAAGHGFHLVAPVEDDRSTKGLYFQSQCLNSLVVLACRDIAQQCRCSRGDRLIGPWLKGDKWPLAACPNSL